MGGLYYFQKKGLFILFNPLNLTIIEGKIPQLGQFVESIRCMCNAKHMLCFHSEGNLSYADLMTARKQAQQSSSCGLERRVHFFVQ